MTIENQHRQTKDSLRRLARRWWPPYLREDIKSLHRQINMCCNEWADDHTHLQNLCRKAGYDDLAVDGDSYGVPGISDLADLLMEKIESSSTKLGN